MEGHTNNFDQTETPALEQSEVVQAPEIQPELRAFDEEGRPVIDISLLTGESSPEKTKMIMEIARQHVAGESPFDNAEFAAYSPEQQGKAIEITEDVAALAEGALEGNRAAQISALSTEFASTEIIEEEGTPTALTQTPSLAGRIMDFASRNSNALITAGVISLAVFAPHHAEAGGLDFKSITKQVITAAVGKGTGQQQVGNVFEKQQRMSQVEQQIKTVQGYIETNNDQIRRLNDESERAKQALDVQMRGQNRQVGGEISAQDKVYTAQEKAQVKHIEGLIKLENAQFAQDNPNPTAVATAKHEIIIGDLQSQIDLLVANAQATNIRQDNTKAAVNTQGEFAGIDLAGRIQNNNNQAKGLGYQNDQYKEQIRQLEIQKRKIAIGN